VTLIDPAEPGQQTSFGNAGIISPWSIVPQAVPGIWKAIPSMLMARDGPLAVRPAFWPRMIPWGLRFLAMSGADQTRRVADQMEVLCAPSIDLFRRHLRGTGHEALVADSWYVHAFRNADKARMDDLGYRIRREKGADIALLGADALHSLEPAVSQDFKAAIVIKGQARARAPGRIGQVLATKAQAQGATLLRARVHALRKTDTGWHLDTDQGPHTAPQVVLAAGVWSADLLRPLGYRVPLVAERGYHVQYAGAQAELTHSVMDVDAKIVASSMEEGLRVAGSSEFGAIDAPPDPRKQKLLDAQARAMVPALEGLTPQVWMGRRPSFPDSLPALGPIKGQAGLFAAFGHAHYGLMMAPKSGELVADWITGTPPNMDLSALSMDRF